MINFFARCWHAFIMLFRLCVFCRSKLCLFTVKPPQSRQSKGVCTCCRTFNLKRLKRRRNLCEVFGCFQSVMFPGIVCMSRCCWTDSSLPGHTVIRTVNQCLFPPEDSADSSSGRNLAEISSREGMTGSCSSSGRKHVESRRRWTDHRLQCETIQEVVSHWNSKCRVYISVSVRDATCLLISPAANLHIDIFISGVNELDLQVKHSWLCWSCAAGQLNLLEHTRVMRRV